MASRVRDERPGETLTISKAVLLTENEIIQTENVSYFGSGSKKRYRFSWIHVLSLTLISLAILSFRDRPILSTVVAVVALGASGWMAYLLTKQPRMYGMSLKLNSGDTRFFPTEDRAGTEAVLQKIAKMLTEMAERVDRAAVISITASKVTMRETTVNGVLAAGDVAGDIRVEGFGGEGNLDG